MIQLEHLDHHLLMWNVRRKILVSELPRRRLVIQFILKEAGKPDQDYWLMIRPDGETDLCMIDPRFEVDLYVAADLRALTSAWMGHSTFESEVSAGAIVMTGDRLLARSLPKWLRRSSYAGNGGTGSAGGDAEPGAACTLIPARPVENPAVHPVST